MELNQRTLNWMMAMGTFNEVQEGFQRSMLPKVVSLQRGTITENSASAKQQIASILNSSPSRWRKNKAQIAKLQAQLKNSSYNSAQMKRRLPL